MKQQKSKKGLKGSASANDISPADAFASLKLDEIISAVYDSSLPLGKKLAYLYMIAEGSFSLRCLEDIEKELQAIGETLLAKRDAQAKKVEDLTKAIEELELKEEKLMVEAGFEHLRNLEKLVTHISTEQETEHESGTQAEIEKIKKRLMEGEK